jgi:hypothetical protein
MLVVQCIFSHDAGAEAHESKPRIIQQTAWVDASKIRKDCSVRFKGDDRLWRVIHIGAFPMAIAEINQDWQVGGNTEVTARKEKK